MNRHISGCLLWIVVLFAPASLPGQPIAQHPDNPHYFLFQGKPTILITSAEHYGAVVNRTLITSPIWTPCTPTA